MNKKLLGLLVLLAFFFTNYAQAGLPLFDSQQMPLPSLSPLVKKINPAVVNISVSQTHTANNPLLNDPFFQEIF